MNTSRCVAARTATWLGSCALLLTLAACGGGGNSGTVPEPAPPLTPSGGEQQAQIFKASDYFGGNAGDQLVFARTDAIALTWSARIEHVETLERNASTAGASIESTNLDRTSRFRHYICLDRDGLWASNSPIYLNDRGDALLLLPDQFKVGDSFVQESGGTSTPSTDANGTPYYLEERIQADVTIMAREDIATHAGLFKNCVKTRTVRTSVLASISDGIRTQLNRHTSTTVSWYAPSIGKVREIVDDDIDPSTQELYAYNIAGVANELVRPTGTVDGSRLYAKGAFVMQFSEPMLMATLNTYTLQIIDPNGRLVPFSASLASYSAGRSIEITPDPTYEPISGVYRFKVSDEAKDLAGNGLIPIDQSLEITISRMCCDFRGVTIWLWAH